MKANRELMRLIGLALATLPALHALAAGDTRRGAQLFRQCAACHSVQPGEHLTGPSLAHVSNRKAGTAQGFQRYSEALKRSGLTWNDATLDKWIAGPERLVPGNSMTYPGLRNAKDREDLIAYLKAVDDNQAPQASGKDGMSMGGMGMGGMRARRTDLRKAPPAAQVTAVSHCGDTYTIATADGKNQKIWEFNLRLKTDSSKSGPAAGKPVVVGSGMRGDRASLVFSSPGEISALIKSACP